MPVTRMLGTKPAVEVTVTVALPPVVTPAARATSAPTPPIMALMKSVWAPVLRMK